MEGITILVNSGLPIFKFNEFKNEIQVFDSSESYNILNSEKNINYTNSKIIRCKIENVSNTLMDQEFYDEFDTVIETTFYKKNSTDNFNYCIYTNLKGERYLFKKLDVSFSSGNIVVIKWGNYDGISNI